MPKSGKFKEKSSLKKKKKLKKEQGGLGKTDPKSPLGPCTRATGAQAVLAGRRVEIWSLVFMRP